MLLLGVRGPETESPFPGWAPQLRGDLGPTEAQIASLSLFCRPLWGGLEPHWPEQGKHLWECPSHVLTCQSLPLFAFGMTEAQRRLETLWSGGVPKRSGDCSPHREARTVGYGPVASKDLRLEK